jgi:Uma2 family endonuclease
VASQPHPFLTPEQYLEIERAADYRSEYLDGEMFAMAGGSPRHNIIINNIGRALHLQIRGRCRYFTTDLRLFVPATGLYTYPDLMVICGPIAYEGDRKDIVTNPRFIVEVLSPSTATYDRGNKLVHYRSIPTLSDYLTVAQDETRAEHTTRQPDGSWLLRTFTLPDDTIHIASLDAEIRLRDVYDDLA